MFGSNTEASSSSPAATSTQPAGLSTTIAQTSSETTLTSTASTAASNLNKPSAFWIGLQADSPASVFDLNLTDTKLDNKNEVNSQQGQFLSKTADYYWFHWSAGVRSQTDLLLAIGGVYPSMRLVRESTSHFASSGDVVDVFARDTTTYVQIGMNVFLRNDRKGAASDIFSAQTSLMGYSLSEVADLWTWFQVSARGDVTPSTANGRIRFDSIDWSPGSTPFNPVFKQDGNYYLCETSGVYVFHVSIGILASQPATASLKVGNQAYEIIRESTSHNGRDTLSRSVFASCNAGWQVHVELTAGIAHSDEQDRLTTLIGFKLKNPTEGFTKFRLTEFAPVGNALQYVDFTEQSYPSAFINSKGIFDGRFFTVNVPGIYHIYFSVGATGGKRVEVHLYKKQGVNISLVTTITRQSTSHNGVDTLGRSVLLRLAAGDKLYTMARGGTSVFSNSGLQTSFMGMLVFKD